MTPQEALYVQTVTDHLRGQLVDADGLADALAYLDRAAARTLEASWEPDGTNTWHDRLMGRRAWVL